MAKKKKISGFLLVLSITILLILMGLVNSLVQNSVSADSFLFNKPPKPQNPQGARNSSGLDDSFQPPIPSDAPVLDFN